MKRMVAMTCLSDFRARLRYRLGFRPCANGVAVMTLLLVFVSPVRSEVRVVTTTPGYAHIVKEIAGEHAIVESIMRGPEDIHNVVAKPSHMMKLKKADLFIHSGLDAELWAPLLVKGSRNAKLLPGQPGNVDVSRGIEFKEVPARGGVTRALGDIHAYGNIHYWLDPLNIVVVARTITDALKGTEPKHADEFEHNYQEYAEGMRESTARLVAKMAPYRGTKVVTYHRTWPYFRDRFGLVKVAEVEPKPGISPGPRHLTACVERMKAQGVKMVIVETYNSKKNADVVARRAGGKAVVLAQEVHAVSEVDTYEKLFEYNVGILLAAFKELGIEPEGGSTERGVTATDSPTGR